MITFESFCWLHEDVIEISELFYVNNETDIPELYVTIQSRIVDCCSNEKEDPKSQWLNT